MHIFSGAQIGESVPLAGAFGENRPVTAIAKNAAVEARAGGSALYRPRIDAVAPASNGVSAT